MAHRRKCSPGFDDYRPRANHEPLPIFIDMGDACLLINVSPPTFRQRLKDGWYRSATFRKDDPKPRGNVKYFARTRSSSTRSAVCTPRATTRAAIGVATNTDPIAELIRYGERGEMPPDRLLRAAAARYVELIDRPEPDPRRVRSRELAMRVGDLRYGRRLRRAIICERLDLSIDQYNRALREWRDP